MTYPAATNDRDTRYIEQEAEHAKRESVLDARERFAVREYDWQPLLEQLTNAWLFARLRKTEYGNACYRLIQLVEQAVDNDWPDVIVATEPLIAKYVRLRNEAEKEIELVSFTLGRVNTRAMGVDEADRLLGELNTQLEAA